jgi:hypothetical protein
MRAGVCWKRCCTARYSWEQKDCATQGQEITEQEEYTQYPLRLCGSTLRHFAVEGAGEVMAAAPASVAARPGGELDLSGAAQAIALRRVSRDHARGAGRGIISAPPVQARG